MNGICYHCCIDANKTITKILDLSYHINRAYGFSHRYTKLNENIWMNLEGMSSQFPDGKSEFALIAHLRPLMRLLTNVIKQYVAQMNQKTQNVNKMNPKMYTSYLIKPTMHSVWKREGQWYKQIHTIKPVVQSIETG
eukprot:824975_1